jgi:hypothetical protein
VIDELKKAITDTYAGLEGVRTVYLLQLGDHYEINALLTRRDFALRDRIYESEEDLRKKFPMLSFRFKTVASTSSRQLPKNAIECPIR